MYYIIVEEGIDGMWETRYRRDPKKHPVDASQSAYHSVYGRMVGVRLWYKEEDLDRVGVDIKKLLRLNPRGGYCAAKLKGSE